VNRSEGPRDKVWARPGDAPGWAVDGEHDDAPAAPGEQPAASDEGKVLWQGLLDYTTSKATARLFQPPHPRGGVALPKWQRDTAYAGHPREWSPLLMGEERLIKACATLAAELRAAKAELADERERKKQAHDSLRLANWLNEKQIELSKGDRAALAAMTAARDDVQGQLDALGLMYIEQKGELDEWTATAVERQAAFFAAVEARRAAEGLLRETLDKLSEVGGDSIPVVRLIVAGSRSLLADLLAGAGGAKAGPPLTGQDE
jgi:hypothetical protein